MKKLLLGLISTLLLASTSAQAVVFARQLWQHPNGKKVELFYDAYAYILAGVDSPGSIDQRDLLISSNAPTLAQQQQVDIIHYAKLFGDKVHIFAEDIIAHLIDKDPTEYGYLLKLEDTLEMKDTLTMLTRRCKDAGISHTNIECRNPDGSIDKVIVDRIALFNDNRSLNNLYYRALYNRDNYRIIDIPVIHTLYEYTHNKHPEFRTKDRILIVAGGLHCLHYSQALSLMGYKRLSAKQRISPPLQKIMRKPECSGEKIIQSKTKYLLGSGDIFSALTDWAYSFTPSNSIWAVAFFITHPLDIAQIIEEERKELATRPASAAEFALRMAAPPVVVTPAIRARL